MSDTYEYLSATEEAAVDRALAVGLTVDKALVYAGIDDEGRQQFILESAKFKKKSAYKRERSKAKLLERMARLSDSDGKSAFGATVWLLENIYPETTVKGNMEGVNPVKMIVRNVSLEGEATVEVNGV